MTLVPLVVLLLAVAATVAQFVFVPAQGAAPVAEPMSVVAPAPSPEDLSDLLLAEVPGMEEIEPYPEHTDGLTLDETAELDGAVSAAAKTALREQGFERGVIRWWLLPEVRALNVSVSEYSDASGARARMTDVGLSYARDPTIRAVSTAVPGSVAYGYPVPEDGSYVYELFFAKGTRVYRMTMINLDGAPGGEDLLADVATEQYTRG